MPGLGQTDPRRWSRIRSILQDFADGEILKRVAAKHGVKENSVRSDMFVYRRKHKLKTTHQAIAHAIRTGEIK